MQDFLSQINQKMIQGTIHVDLERNHKLKTFILKQKNLITEKIQQGRQVLINLLKKKFQTKLSSQNSQIIDPFQEFNSDIKYEDLNQNLNYHQTAKINKFSSHFKPSDLQHCFSMFSLACNNILNTYFPLLMQDEILSMQNELEIRNKIYFFNKTVEKSIQLTTKQILKLSFQSTQSIKPKLYKLSQKDQQSFQVGQSHFTERKNNNKSNKIKLKNKKISKKGKNSKIPYELTFPLQKWLLQNFNDPYPSCQEKQKIAKESGLTYQQVNNWFINSRQRVIKKFLKKGQNQCDFKSEDFQFSNDKRIQKQNKVKKNNNKKIQKDVERKSEKIFIQN